MNKFNKFYIYYMSKFSTIIKIQKKSSKIKFFNYDYQSYVPAQNLIKFQALNQEVFINIIKHYIMLNQQNFIEQLVNKLNGTSRFQNKMFCNFMIKWIIAALILFSLNFFYYVPDFKCTQEQMKGFETCESYVCSVESEAFWRQHLPLPLPRSISLDFGITLVCSNQWISSLLQSMSYLGSLIGFIVMPHIADNNGRKMAQAYSWRIAIIGSCVLLVSMNLWLVGIGSFLMGFGCNSCITLHYSFIKELVVGQRGRRMIIALQVSFSFGVFLISFLSMVFTFWKLILLYFILIPSLAMLFIEGWIQQTPQYYLKTSPDNLYKSLNKIAKVNKVQPLTQQDLQKIQQASQNIKNDQNNKILSLIDLFTHRTLLKLTVICGLTNFIIQFTYDGTILSLSKIGIDVFWNQILVGLVQMTAAVFASWIVVQVRRKFYCSISFLIVAVSTLIIGLLSLFDTNQDDSSISVVQIFQMIVLAVLRFALNATWGVFFVFIAQLYPAQITSLSFGWTSIVGTVGATLSPFIRLSSASSTMFLMCSLNVCAFIIIQFLKQTKGKPIILTINQLNKCQGETKNTQNEPPSSYQSEKKNNYSILTND